MYNFFRMRFYACALWMVKSSSSLKLRKKLHCFLAHNFVRKIKLSVMTKPFITKNEEDGHEKCMNQNDTILKKGFILCSHFCY